MDFPGSFFFGVNEAKDLGPEGIHFISDDDSPTGIRMIAVANEVSGTTTLYELAQTR